MLHRVWKSKKKAGEPSHMSSMSSQHSYDNGDVNGSKQILDKEFGIPSIKTLGIKKAHEIIKAGCSDSKPNRSNRKRNFVHLTYDAYLTWHHAMNGDLDWAKQLMKK